jgi:radical SAM superfamily enzyme YgiQ (UPF0313 family)
MYRSKSYRVRPQEEIDRELDACFASGMSPEKIFLCDGDALGAPQGVLVATLDKINTLWPKIRRVGIYATGSNILEKTEEELKLLSSKKLNIAYLGLESGDDKVLHMIVKGNTAAEMIEASLKIKKCGFKLSTIAMLGVGGKKYSKQHVENTARVLSATAPEFFSFLTTFSVPGTPYHKMVQRGSIEPLTSKELLTEMHDILKLANFDLNPIIFRANHVSNLHPLAGNLPRDKDVILNQISKWINATPEGLYPEVPLQM